MVERWSSHHSSNSQAFLFTLHLLECLPWAFLRPLWVMAHQDFHLFQCHQTCISHLREFLLRFLASQFREALCHLPYLEALGDHL